jgi:flagellar FliL protein
MANTEATRGGSEAKTEGEAAPAAAAPAPGGIKAFLPLIIAVVLMPTLAFVMTKFVILPKLTTAVNARSAAPAEAAPAGKEAAPAEAAKDGAPAADGKTSANSKGKITVPLTKILVNVSGTMGTRYLMTSVTLVSKDPDFKNKVEENKDQLMDLANGTLSTKTISDLEKPGARNVIRAELMTVFNNAFGGPVVSEIYITELAIQ